MTVSRYKTYKIVPMIIVMGTIFFLSSIPGDEINLPEFSHSDLVAHMIAYGALGMAVCFAWKDDFIKNQPLKAYFLTVAFCLFYGISDEFHQYFVPGRFVSGLDIAADCLGAVLACITWLFAKKIRRLSPVS